MKKLLVLLTMILSFTTASLNAREVSLETKITGLYAAYFNRAPDLQGLNYWKHKGETAQHDGIDVSTVLKKLSEGFALHPTFIATYGDMDDMSFVEEIYRNALGRDGERAGITYWTTQLENGTSRSDMVATFVDAALVFDLTPENYPDLTAEQLAAAQLRQDLITNKTEASLAFINLLGSMTNITGSGEHPEEVKQYKASIAIVFTITEDHATVDNVIKFLEDIQYNTDPISEILKLRYGGEGSVSSLGGIFVAGDVKLFIPVDGILKDINISVLETPLPQALPSGLVATGKNFNIHINDNDQDIINAPLKVTVRYDDSNIEDEHTLLVLHYNDETHSYEPVRIIAQDTTANTILFDSRTFSSFVVARTNTALPMSFDTTFRAAENGWDINNFGSYFSPDGNSFGMAGYATWYFSHNNNHLHDKYTAQIATLVATRTQLAQNQTWGLSEWRREQRIAPQYVGMMIKAYMSILNRPLVLLAGIDGNAKRAMVVYKYDAEQFYFYDINIKDMEQTVRFDGTAFGSYDRYNSFGFVALASFGRTEDFAQLTVEAENGFTTSKDITLNSPSLGENITEHTTRLAGSLSNVFNSDVKLYATVKGISREIPLSSNTFNQEIEITQGENTIILLAGVDLSKQSNWAKNGATLIRTVNGDFAASKLLVTLTWDQDKTDVDLYITEPNGETMWYSDTETSSKLKLDVDDVDGYGPEHGTLTESARTVGTVQEGNYIVRVHYYNDHSYEFIPATGHVNIVINEGTEDQVEKTVPFRLLQENSSNDAPGSIGSDWADIAVVDVKNGVIH